MRIPRFFVAPSSIDASSRQVYISDAAQLKQMLSVLRLERGSLIDVLDGTGTIFHCSVASVSRKNLQASIESSERVLSDAAVHITVALPLLKSGRFEWAIEKLTELGVWRIIPLVCARSVVRPSPDDAAKRKRWHAIAREAAEQCERGTIPEVVSPVALEELHSQASPTGACAKGCLSLMCAERQNAEMLQDVIARMQRDDAKCGAQIQNLLIVVGPEGGFTDEEFALASDIGLRFVNLGKRILRSETAAIYALSIATSFLDN